MSAVITTSSRHWWTLLPQLRTKWYRILFVKFKIGPLDYFYRCRLPQAK